MGCSITGIFNAVSGWFERRFENFGRIIGKYAKIFIPVCILITAGLGCGMITQTTETSIEVLYTPVNSRASQDRTKYQDTFPDVTATSFIDYALTKEDMFGDLLLIANDGNVFSDVSIAEIRSHIGEINSIQASYQAETFNYSDICAARDGNCVISGEFLTNSAVVALYKAGNLTYPDWNGIVLSRYLGEANVTNGKLLSAKYLRVTFHLRQSSEDDVAKAKSWEDEFLTTVSTLNTSATTVLYASSQSLNSELDTNTAGDIVFFSITFSLMITYATVIVGGDVVSSRTWASWAGVAAAGFGIISSFGLLSLCGVQYVNIVGVMPFLIIGIGVDDMFLLMSSWADTYEDESSNICDKMAKTFRTAGIGITITSITDLLAFVVGASSVFISVRIFCIYTGVAVAFCYLYQCFFFGSCLSLHGRRVDDYRHCFTCLKTESKKSLKDQGKSRCTVICCGGSRPECRGQDERFLETMPRKYLPTILLNGYGYAVVLFLYFGYLGVSIWGVLNFGEGLELKNLVSPTSYYHTYAEAKDNYYDNSFPISFVFDSTTNYIDIDTVNSFESLFDAAKLDVNINGDSLICWFHSYRNAPMYDNTTQASFIAQLKIFLDAVPIFKPDIVFDSTNSTITSSRCYLFSESIIESSKQADLMTRMRDLADSSPLSVYAFHPAFIYFEQYVAILSSTLQTVGITLAVMTVVTFIFLPHPLLVLLVVLNIVSILVGIFGFLYFWDLTLSSVTMIHLIMSVGFSVDFSVHVCSAYMLSKEETRKLKATTAITHACGPILNGGLSSFLGIIVLVFSKSYIFNSFFRIMFTVILFGMLHAVFLLPVVLCICGPLPSNQSTGTVTPPPDYPLHDNPPTQVK